MKVPADKKKSNPKGDKNKDDAMYGSKSFKPQKKETEVHALMFYQPKQIGLQTV
jgi:hypothetical protein